MNRGTIHETRQEIEETTSKTSKKSESKDKSPDKDPKKIEPVHRYVDDFDELNVWDLNSLKHFEEPLPTQYQADFSNKLFSEYFIVLIENSQRIIKSK